MLKNLIKALLTVGEEKKRTGTPCFLDVERGPSQLPPRWEGRFPPQSRPDDVLYGPFGPASVVIESVVNWLVTNSWY